MKTINFVVGREYIQKISKINDKDVNSLLYHIFIDRELGYAENFMKELTDASGLDDLERVFVGFKTSSRKYVTYICSSNEISGNYKIGNQDLVEKQAWRYFMSNYNGCLFMTDKPTGDIVQNLLENRGIEFEVLRK